MDEISENLAGTAGDNTFIYTFNPANQIKTLSVSNQTYAVDHSAQGRPGVYETNGLNQYTMANGGILDYDTDGNLTLDEQEDAVYEYSIENQLTKVIKDGTITELGYDATGKLLNIGDTYFLYDGEAVIAEYNQQDCYPCGRTMTKRYVHSVGIDDPIVQYNSSGTYSYLMTYLHKNHQGSVVAGSSYTGSLSYTNGYDSFGVPETTNQGRFAYTGQMYLEEIGLYYYKARIYNPKLGRFLQVDPIGYEDQMNLYAYVHNDPVNNKDSSGKCAEPVSLSFCTFAVYSGAAIIGASLGDALSSFDDDTYNTSIYDELLPKIANLCGQGNEDACLLLEKVRRQKQVLVLRKSYQIADAAVCMPGTLCGGPIPSSPADIAAAPITTFITTKARVGSVKVIDLPPEVIEEEEDEERDK